MLTGMRIYYAFEFALSILSASASTIDPRIRRIPYLPYSIPLSTIFDKQTHFAANICQWWSHTYFSSVTQLCPTLCDPMDCSTPGFPVHHRLLDLLKLNSIKSVMPTYHFILCHPLLLLPSVLPSIRVFSNESTICHQVAKVLEFQLQHQSLQGIFRTDFLSDSLVWSPSSPRDSQ